MNVGIFGCGFSGKAIGRKFAETGNSVWGTTRDKARFSSLSNLGIQPVPFNGKSVDRDLIRALGSVTHLIISIAPPREENHQNTTDPVDPVLNAFQGLTTGNPLPNLKWVGYLSTVGVYGNYDGAWIDETAQLNPSSARSRQRVRAESEWQDFAKETDTPLAIFRLSGIYGPGRNALVNAHAGKSRRLIKKDQVFNRIHREDIATAVSLAAGKSIDGVFNVTDDEPAPPQDVVTYAHSLLGTTPPEEIDFETADLSAMARSFYGENKRVSNAKSKSGLGMTYDWPNYRAALRRMYDEETWKDAP